MYRMYCYITIKRNLNYLTQFNEHILSLCYFHEIHNKNLFSFLYNPMTEAQTCRLIN